MKCPIDTNIDLVMTDRQGIEIDYCPSCRGVWLDRGELDKIIERAAPVAPVAPVAPAAPAAPVAPAAQPRRYDDDDSDGYQRPGYPKKKKSLLGELFDF
ncbi:MAG: zf-TFIIB domain-containing protein [Ilumatobacteraceae bacterium]|jgi:Zn-finger nucleic acid-binding protein